jgi:hypothetical protein
MSNTRKCKGCGRSVSIGRAGDFDCPPEVDKDARVIVHDLFPPCPMFTNTNPDYFWEHLTEDPDAPN